MNNKSEWRQRIALEERVVQLSCYCDVIQAVLSRTNSMTVTKLLILAFILKGRMNSQVNVLDGRTRKNTFSKAACESIGRFQQLQNELPYFAEALHILIENEYVRLKHGGEVELNMQDIRKYNLGSFEKKLIQECMQLEDKYVLMEVLSNV